MQGQEHLDNDITFTVNDNSPLNSAQSQDENLLKKSRQRDGEECFLLRLPAELRNEIYRFMLADLEDGNNHIMQRIRKGARIGDAYRSFAQTSTQFRDEFRPLYVAQKEVRVIPTTAMQYLRTFHRSPAQKTIRRVGNLDVLLPQCHRSSDLYSLLKFCLVKHNIRLRFHDKAAWDSTRNTGFNMAACADMLNAALENHGDAWGVALEKELEWVAVVFIVRPKVVFAVKWDAGIDWMRDPRFQSDIFKADRIAFCSRLGLDEKSVEFRRNG